MTTHEFTLKIDELFENEVFDILTPNWSEDLITVNFLNAFVKEFNDVYVDDLHSGSRIFVNTFKQKGKVETKYGDIAVLVKITYEDHSVLEGVGYMEAKTRHIKQGDFRATKVVQLKTINSNAPRARLLLYDYEPIVGFIGTHGSPGNIYSVALPINVALIPGTAYDRSLYKFGLPMSHQIVYRYMNAHDLEFDESVIAGSRKFGDDSGHSNYILSVNIVRSNGENVPGFKENSGHVKVNTLSGWSEETFKRNREDLNTFSMEEA